MSVPVRKRKTSKLQVYSKVMSFRKTMISYLLTNMNKFEDQIPEWLLRYIRWDVLKKLTELTDYIMKASAITMVNRQHFEIRQEYFIRSKGICESLISSLQLVSDLFPNRIKLMEQAVNELDTIYEMVNKQIGRDIQLFQ